MSRLVQLSKLVAAQFVSSRRTSTGSELVLYSDVNEPAAIASPTAPSIAIFLPAFNEAANIEQTVERALHALRPIASRFKVIVVDDGSTDATGRLASELAGAHPDHVAVVGHPRNRGYGAALRTGFQAGLQTGYDWVGFVDADGQFDLSELDRFLDAAGRHAAQLVAGYRIARADSWRRRQLGHAWDRLTGRIVNHGLRDIDCGFKLVHRNVLLTIELSGTHASISPELAAKARRAGTTIVQVGVTHYPRSGGSQTGANLKVVARSLRGLVDLRREIAALQT